MLTLRLSPRKMIGGGVSEGTPDDCAEIFLEEKHTGRWVVAFQVATTWACCGGGVSTSYADACAMTYPPGEDLVGVEWRFKRVAEGPVRTAQC